MTYEEATPQSTIETMERHKNEAGVAFLGWVKFTADEYYIVKQALEKQVPREIVKDYLGFLRCPNCGQYIDDEDGHGIPDYCPDCGQKLAWG